MCWTYGTTLFKHCYTQPLIYTLVHFFLFLLVSCPEFNGKFKAVHLIKTIFQLTYRYVSRLYGRLIVHNLDYLCTYIHTYRHSVVTRCPFLSRTFQLYQLFNDLHCIKIRTSLPTPVMCKCKETVDVLVSSN